MRGGGHGDDQVYTVVTILFAVIFGCLLSPVQCTEYVCSIIIFFFSIIGMMHPNVRMFEGGKCSDYLNKLFFNDDEHSQLFGAGRRPHLLATGALGANDTAVSPASLDDTRLFLIFCTVDGCRNNEQIVPCYCCQNSRLPKPPCYATVEECRSNCPHCDPHCPPQQPHLVMIEGRSLSHVGWNASLIK